MMLSVYSSFICKFCHHFHAVVDVFSCRVILSFLLLKEVHLCQLTGRGPQGHHDDIWGLLAQEMIMIINGFQEQVLHWCQLLTDVLEITVHAQHFIARQFLS